MKKRRLVLGSLLLAAVLVMGIGFAALVDTLNITGTATFRPAGVVETDVDAAIYFTTAAPDEDYCISANVDSNPDIAYMTVVFNDAGETNRIYEATATFTVLYQPTDANAHLPAVKLTPSASILTTGTSNPAPGFTVNVAHEHIGAVAEEGMFSPGESMKVTVTVTCNADEITNTTSNSEATISVSLAYDTIAVNDASAN